MPLRIDKTCTYTRLLHQQQSATQLRPGGNSEVYGDWSSEKDAFTHLHGPTWSAGHFKASKSYALHNEVHEPKVNQQKHLLYLKRLRMGLLVEMTRRDSSRLYFARLATPANFGEMCFQNHECSRKSI